MKRPPRHINYFTENSPTLQIHHDDEKAFIFSPEATLWARSLREMARQLGISHTTVHRRLKHIKQALEELNTGIPEALVK